MGFVEKYKTDKSIDLLNEDIVVIIWRVLQLPSVRCFKYRVITICGRGRIYGCCKERMFGLQGNGHSLDVGKLSAPQYYTDLIIFFTNFY